MTVKRAAVVVGILLLGAIAFAFLWPLGNHNSLLHLPGVVEIQEVRLGSKIGGRVEQVLVEEGMVVKPEQELITIAVPELRAQEQQADARLKAALAELDKARTGFRAEEKAAAKAAVENAVAKLDLLKAGARPEEIREAQSQLDSAEAEQRLSKEEFERAKRLLAQNASARAEFDTSRMALERNTGLAARAKAHLDLLQAGFRKEEIAQAQAELKRLQANYDLLLAGTRSEDIASAEARAAEAQGKLAEIRAMLEEAVVRAPEKAFVDIVAVRKGDLVTPNQPVIRVLRATDLWVKVYVPETELGKLRPDQEVQVTMDAYPDRQFIGKIIHISAESEFTPRNVQSPDERRHQVFGVKVQVKDAEGIFKSGMAAMVTLPLQ